MPPSLPFRHKIPSFFLYEYGPLIILIVLVHRVDCPPLSIYSFSRRNVFGTPGKHDRCASLYVGPTVVMPRSFTTAYNVNIGLSLPCRAPKRLSDTDQRHTCQQCTKHTGAPQTKTQLPRAQRVQAKRNERDGARGGSRRGTTALQRNIREPVNKNFTPSERRELGVPSWSESRPTSGNDTVFGICQLAAKVAKRQRVAGARTTHGQPPDCTAGQRKPLREHWRDAHNDGDRHRFGHVERHDKSSERSPSGHILFTIFAGQNLAKEPGARKSSVDVESDTASLPPALAPCVDSSPSSWRTAPSPTNSKLSAESNLREGHHRPRFSQASKHRMFLTHTDHSKTSASPVPQSLLTVSVRTTSSSRVRPKDSKRAGCHKAVGLSTQTLLVPGVTRSTSEEQGTCSPRLTRPKTDVTAGACRAANALPTRTSDIATLR